MCEISCVCVNPPPCQTLRVTLYIFDKKCSLTREDIQNQSNHSYVPLFSPLSAPFTLPKTSFLKSFSFVPTLPTLPPPSLTLYIYDKKCSLTQEDNQNQSNQSSRCRCSLSLCSFHVAPTSFFRSRFLFCLILPLPSPHPPLTLFFDNGC